MFDILAFLIEQYLAPEDRPERGVLARRLAAIGFEEEEIGEALDCLTAFDAIDPAPYEQMVALTGSARVLSPQEASLLSADAQAFFYYLGEAAVLTFGERELLIDSLLSNAAASPIDLHAIQRMTLLLLWRRGDDRSVMLIEALLYQEEDSARH